MIAQAERIRDGLIRRFGAYRMTEHWLAILLFCVLVLTGLSQKFYYLEASQWLIISLGGIDDTRLIHRWSGICFALLCLEHIAVAAFGLMVLRWQPHMIITKKDFQDARHNLRYYIGLEARPSMCARYNYKEKFVYWLVLTGGMIMVCTGLCLWFPTEVVRVLPGQLIPAAKVMHSSEAMLIFLLLAVWHIYDSIFSPDVFPLDTSIFTGYITRERMVREHPIELAEIEGVSPEELDEGRGGPQESGEAGGP